MADKVTKNKNNLKFSLAAVAGFSPFLIISSASAEYDVVQESITGLTQYLIFKNEGANLSSGELVADSLEGTGLNMVVVTPDQLGNKDPMSVAQLIQKNTEDVDTVVLIVDGDKDNFYVASSDSTVQSELQSFLGTDAVDDAGWSLLDNSDEMLYTYYKSGGNIDSTYASTLTERIEQSNVVQSSVTGLENDHVFVNQNATLSHETDLEATFTKGDIDVVVVSADSTSLSPDQIGESIFTEHETSNSLIVVIDGSENDEISVVSSDTEMAEEMSGVIGDSVVPDAGETLQNVSTELVSVESSYLTPGEKIVNASGYIGVGLGVILVGVGIYYGIKKTANSIKNKREREMTYSKKLHEKYSDVNDSFLDSMVNLEKLSVLHGKDDKNNLLSKNVEELSRRLHDMLDVMEDNKISNGKRRELEIGYADKLHKLNELLGDKYYMDLVENPDYWDNTEIRKKQVENVLQGMIHNVVDNIKRVNKNHDLDVQVALTALEGVQQNYFSNVFEASDKKNTVIDDSGKGKKKPRWINRFAS